MHIICPNCGLKSPVETGGLAVETRLVCTRCEVEVEIKFTDEPGAEAATTEIALFEGFAETLEEKLGSRLAAPSGVEETVEVVEAEAGDVLGLESLPPTPREENSEEGLVLETAQPVVLEPQPQPAADESLSDTQQEDEDGEGLSGAYPLPNFERAPAHAAQSFDKYSIGVRMMQASPVWLLVAGLSFISFIVLCNWFFVPSNLAQAEPSRPAARGNQATNLSSEQTTAPAQPADDVADAREEAQPAAQPADQPTETSVRTAQQPTPEPAPTSSPTPATAQTAAPLGDTTSAPAEAARAQSAGSNSAPDGKFTLQVGSYNVAAEAESRASSLKAAGVEARVAQVEIPKRGTWYRVQAGRFASREEAERGGRQLREKGLAASYLTAALQ